MRLSVVTRLLSVSVLAAVMVAFAGGSVGSAAPPVTGLAERVLANTAAGYRPSGQECAFLSLINTYRKQNGVGALSMTRTLGASAEHHSVDMSRTGVVSHTMSNGVSWSQNMSNHGYTYSTARGENIAAGNYAAQDTFNQWRRSSGHNANMLNRNFKAIGIGQVSNANSRYGTYWTTVFGGVVDKTIGC